MAPNFHWDFELYWRTMDSRPQCFRIFAPGLSLCTLFFYHCCFKYFDTLWSLWINHYVTNICSVSGVVSEYNRVSWDILIKMLISWTMWKYTISCKLNHMKLLQITGKHELVNPFTLFKMNPASLTAFLGILTEVMVKQWICKKVIIHRKDTFLIPSHSNMVW